MATDANCEILAGFVRFGDSNSDQLNDDQSRAGMSGNDDESIPTVDQRELRRKLFEIRSEHRDLDDVIARISEEAPFDQLQLQRLKKRKLILKDEISRLEDMLLPDIIA